MTELDHACICGLGAGGCCLGFETLSDRVVRAEEGRIRMSGSPRCSRSDSADGSQVHTIPRDLLTCQREAFMMGQIIS